MDPLSIAAAVIAFVEIAISIRNSAGKVRSNARRLCELSDDIVADLSALRDFCVIHRQGLLHGTELFDSMLHLRRQLREALAHCERLAEEQSPSFHKSFRIRSRIRAWRKADQIEAYISRLRDQVRSALFRVHLFIAARTEITTAKTEQQVLVLRSTVQSHIHRFDGLFSETVAQGKLGSLESVFHHEELDPWDCEYLRFKYSSVARTVAGLEVSQVVIDGCFKPCFYDYVISASPLNACRYWAIRGVSKLCQFTRPLQDGRITSFNISRFIQVLTSYRSYIHLSGSTNSIPPIYDFCKHMFNKIVPLCPDDDNIWVVMMSFLYLPSSGAGLRYDIQQQEEKISIERGLLARSLVAKGTYSTSFHHLRLLGDLSLLAALYSESRENRDNDEVLSVTNEVLYRVYSGSTPIPFETFIPITLDPHGMGDDSIRTSIRASPSYDFMVDCRIVQGNALMLSHCFSTLLSIARYSEARVFGTASLQLMESVISQSHQLPSDFYLFSKHLDPLRRDLSNSFYVQRHLRDNFLDNGGAYEDEEGSIWSAAEHTREVVQWGIAI